MFLTINLMVLASSIDSIFLGMNYGIKDIKIPFKSKVLIFLITVISSGLALFLGRKIGSIIPGLSNIIGEISLFFIGIYILYSSISEKEIKRKQKTECVTRKKYFEIAVDFLGITIMIIKNPSKGDLDDSGEIDLKEACFLSVALSIDSFAICISAGLMSINSFFIPLLMGITHLAFFIAGKKAGLYLNRCSNKKIWTALPGIILICISFIKIIF